MAQNNGIEVANIFGEGEPGCLNSYFVNDSTLVREYSWDELDENENVIENASQRTEKLVIHKDGSCTIVEIKSSEKDEENIDSSTPDPDLYLVKKYSKDTLVGLDYFDKPDVLYDLTLGYPKLILKEDQTTGSNTLKLYNEESSFVFKKIKFDVSKHKIKIIDSTDELLVDGKPTHGTDNVIDCLKWQLDYIKISRYGQSFIVPKKYYTNYFNPHLFNDSIEIYKLPYNRMVIKFSGGDAACSFITVLFFKDNKVIKSVTVDGD